MFFSAFIIYLQSFRDIREFHSTLVRSRMIANLFRSNEAFSRCWNKPRDINYAYVLCTLCENRCAECASEPWTRGANWSACLLYAIHIEFSMYWEHPEASHLAIISGLGNAITSASRYTYAIH